MPIEVFLMKPFQECVISKQLAVLAARREATSKHLLACLALEEELDRIQNVNIKRRECVMINQCNIPVSRCV